MAKLLWIGAGFFAPEITRHETTLHKFFSPRVLTWDDIVRTAGFEPDVLVFGDNSCPPALLGVHRFPCLTAIYAVDTHIHSWLPDYAQAFDLCLVSLKGHMPRFCMRHAPDRLLWSPPYARNTDKPLDVDKTWDVLFVGKNDPLVAPQRHAFLAGLGERAPLTVKQGKYFELYPYAKIVLNESWRGDLNYRVFEALGCGACLVTPRVGHGLADLFEDQRDLFTYSRDDMDGLVKLLGRLLADPDARDRAAASGLAKVDAGHRMRHRARAFECFLDGFDWPQLVRNRLEHAREIFESHLRWLYLHWAEAVDKEAMKARYLEAAKAG